MTPKKALVRNLCARLSLIVLDVPGRSHAKDEESEKMYILGFVVTNARYNPDRGFEPLWKAWTDRTAEVGGSKRLGNLFNAMRKIIVGKFIIQTDSPETREFKKREVNFNKNHQI